MCALLWHVLLSKTPLDERSVGLVLAAVVVASAIVVAALARRWNPNLHPQARLKPNSAELGLAMRRAEFERLRREQVSAQHQATSVPAREASNQ